MSGFEIRAILSIWYVWNHPGCFSGETGI